MKMMSLLELILFRNKKIRRGTGGYQFFREVELDGSYE